MNKTELKNFAVSTRRDLLEKVALRAKIFGIDKKNGLTIEERFGQLAINGETYSTDKKSAFLSLKKQLEFKGYEQLIEEVAYTWFNRIIAIRYMEVNEYLPERVNVLSSSTGKVEPDILSEFETMDLDINLVKVKDLIRQGDTEDAYRKLFISQCNALNQILPFMFEKIDDYTELLLPKFLLDSESVITKLVTNEELTDSFREVEVIGWLYQFYNSEPKDKVFANLQKNKKIGKYDIPAATQLFTPKWIVQYMVENSLGQLWLEANPESPLKESMSYYIEPAEQDEEVKQKLKEIRNKNVNLEAITIMDPCVGSGHILVYAFDLLYQMYEEAGYPSGDIPQLILEKNLYGLDIDDRAAQLASFALIMKAREKSRRIFRKNVALNIYSIQESNHLDKEGISQFLGQNEKEEKEILLLLNLFTDAKNYGSTLIPPEFNFEKYLDRISEIGEEQLTIENFYLYEQVAQVELLFRLVNILQSRYDVVLTNPPYMNIKGVNSSLANFMKKFYPESKSDLFAIFMDVLFNLLKSNGLYAIINQQSWMFLKRFENLRDKLINTQTIQSMVHLGTRTFEDIGGEVVQNTAYVSRKISIPKYSGTYVRLVDYNSYLSKQENFFKKENYYISQQEKFTIIPTSPIAYWISNGIQKVYEENETLKNIAETKVGLFTCNNDYFLKYWFEIDKTKMGIGFKNETEASYANLKWFPYHKGGTSKKWFGNYDYVVNYEDSGIEVKEFREKRGQSYSLPGNEYYFNKGITWSTISTGKPAFRYSDYGFVYGSKGNGLFPYKEDNLFFILGLMNSKPIDKFLQITAPTVSLEGGYVEKVPIPKINNKCGVDDLVKECINISERDSNSLETSWNYPKHPLITSKDNTSLLSNAFLNWQIYLDNNFTKIQSNEEELNRIFIDLYELQEDLSPEVIDEEITVRKADRIRDSKSFLSYFIGCIMGRYSLDEEGIIYAGGEWDESKYAFFKPNSFGLIQFTDDYYFENDIILRLREFLSLTFQPEKVEENLIWLAESLELKRNEAAEERLRRYFLDEFFKDHCHVYQKRPIYWLIDSGKQKGLRTLIYMHRYQPDTMATIRFEHLQEIQAKYNNEIAAIDLRIVNPNLSATEKRELEKRKTTFQKRLDELLEFDKNLAEYANAQIDIDLDDGVKVNYTEFEKVLAKIK